MKVELGLNQSPPLVMCVAVCTQCFRPWEYLFSLQSFLDRSFCGDAPMCVAPDLAFVWIVRACRIALAAMLCELVLCWNNPLRGYREIQCVLPRIKPLRGFRIACVLPQISPLCGSRVSDCFRCGTVQAFCTGPTHGLCVSDCSHSGAMSNCANRLLARKTQKASWYNLMWPPCIVPNAHSRSVSERSILSMPLD